MLALDVNVVVAAIRADAPAHGKVRAWLDAAVQGPEQVGVSEAVLTGSLRILTHPRVFNPPTPTDLALDRLEELLAHPNVVLLSAGPGYAEVFGRLCRAVDARGNDVADAGHAATAIAHGATFVTRGRGFGRFPGLRHTATDRAADPPAHP